MGLEIHSETSRIRAAYVALGRLTHEEADARLSASQLTIIIDRDCAHSIAGQAALLTAVATASRCFGRVFVNCPDAPYMLKIPVKALTLRDAAMCVGGIAAQERTPAPTIYLCADPITHEGQGWSIRAYWNRWIAGVLPGNDQRAMGLSECALSGIAAGAMAAAEAFLAEQGAPLAGRRAQLLSLWSLEAGENLETSGPVEFQVPAQLWLFGLGNLGQAYVWSCMALDIENPAAMEIYLQDMDRTSRENFGTSVLVKKGCYGDLKTQVAEQWLRRRGYLVRRVDRRLDQHQRLSDEEPHIALLGLDRIKARCLIDDVGFRHVFDAGLGAAASSYRDIRLNLFDAKYRCREHFNGVEDTVAPRVDSVVRDPYYGQLVADGLTDRCGAAQLAGIPVAVPFVSVVASALAVVQMIRLSSGSDVCRSLKLTVGDLRTLRLVPAETSRRLEFATILAR